ncbi:MAG: hypothetical protein AAGG07_10670 [Planctomycetota bacterium]
MNTRRGAAAAVRRGLACAIAAAGAIAPGCFAPGPSGFIPDATVEYPPPVGPRAGIETRLWWLRDDDARIAKALKDSKSPLGGEERGRFENAGYRLVAIHQRDLDALEDSLAPSGARDRTWRGMIPSWRELVPGVDREEAWVRVGDRSAPLTPGRVRTLGRAFPVPPERPGDGPAMWLELITAHVPESGRLLIIPGTRVGWRAEPGMAYLLVPEAIENDWAEVAEAAEAMPPVPPGGAVAGPAVTDQGDDMGSTPPGIETGAAGGGGSELGPVAIPDPLLGLWSMTRVLPPVHEDAPPRPMRQVLVIVPRASP